MVIIFESCVCMDRNVYSQGYLKSLFHINFSYIFLFNLPLSYIRFKLKSINSKDVRRIQVQGIFGTSRIRYGSCNSFRSSWFEIDFYHFNWNFNCNYCILLYYLFIHHTRNHICCYMCFYILHQFTKIMDVHSQYMLFMLSSMFYLHQSNSEHNFNFLAESIDQTTYR